MAECNGFLGVAVIVARESFKGEDSDFSVGAGLETGSPERYFGVPCGVAVLYRFSIAGVASGIRLVDLGGVRLLNGVVCLTGVDGGLANARAFAGDLSRANLVPSAAASVTSGLLFIIRRFIFFGDGVILIGRDRGTIGVLGTLGNDTPFGEPIAILARDGIAYLALHIFSGVSTVLGPFTSSWPLMQWVSGIGGSSLKSGDWQKAGLRLLNESCKAV